MAPTRVRQIKYSEQKTRRLRNIMNTKPALIAMVGLMLVPAALVRAQTGEIQDFITTWVPYDGTTDPPTPIDQTWIDFSTMPIPQDFFGPGSLPFEGIITLRGFHDGSQPGDTDTIVRRGGDPFAPTDLPGPTVVTVPIELVELRLTSAQPITVTGATWTVDSFFDVFVELSPVPSPPGQLSAVKTHSNGGTFDSFFDIFARMTFTNANDPTDVRVLDLGDLGLPIRLGINGAPWVHQVLIPELIVDPASQFHPFVLDDGSGTQTEVPASAETTPGVPGPIVVHKICLPKPKRVCIYQLDCKSEPAGSTSACQECPYDCKLYQGSPCPNLTCSGGFSAVCPGSSGCCLNFTNVDCRFPAGEPYVPPIVAGCVCDPAPGACCTADGTCSVTTECQCQGTWLGPNTDCGNVGGCCFDDGSCTDGVYQACCELMMGGTFATAGCSGVVGKCCSVDGTCRDNVDANCCDGAFFPNSTCQPPEECCIQGSCSMMDPECCVAFGGTPGGAGSICDPPQKCCLPDGTCANLEPDCCRDLGGTVGQGFCLLAACCLPGGACINTDVECCQLILGGTPHLGLCQPEQACCFGDHSCDWLEPRCCLDEGGTPEGPGTDCDPYGACCTDSDGDGFVDSCQQMSEECCLDIPGGIFHPNADCFVVGACCFDADGDGLNESCTDITQACCQDLPGGTFHGAGTTCTTAGACCYDADGDGTKESCEEMDPLCCTDLGGTFLGAGTVCDTDGDGVDDACGSTAQPCPLGSDWCWSKQTTDCANGVPGEQCWPQSVAVNFAGVPVVNQCACLDNTCGPVYITWLDAVSDWSFRCLNTCPDPTQPCVIHYDGTPTTATSVLAGNVPAGATVTCGCPVTTPDLCTLPAPDPTTFTVDCTNLQSADCVNGAPGEECWPTSVTLDATGTPVANHCACQGTTCGPVDVKWLDAVNDWGYRCLNTCPDPNQQCVIHFNGVSTGSPAVLGSAVPFGVAVTCGCPPQTTDLCPLPSPSGVVDPCTNLQQTDCKNGLANDLCLPVAAVITSSGLPIAKTCDCIGQTGLCGPVTINGDIVSCQGACVPPMPPGQCLVHANGVSTGLPSVHFGDVPVGAVLTCRCSDPPPTDCVPNADQSACEQVACPDTTQKCKAKCAEYDAATGTIKIVDCDCGGPNDCYVAIDTTACQVVDNGTGTADFPPSPCAYGTGGGGGGGRIVVRAGLPQGTTLVMDPVLSDPVCDPFMSGPGGSLGGEMHVCTAVLSLHVTGTGSLQGMERQLAMQLAMEVHTGPRSPGDPIQTFDTDMFLLQGQIFGDPDFDLLRVTGGSGFGMPSPGHTTLTRLGPPGSSFAVDSFFDIEYRIDFQGAAGSVLQGLSGTDITPPVPQLTGKKPYCTGGCPDGKQCIETVTVDPATGVQTVCCDCVDAPTCQPTADGLDCEQTHCPDPAQICRPKVIEFDVLTGQYQVAVCDCVDAGMCHAEIDWAAWVPVCVGDCPAGTVCKQFQADTNNDGVIDQYKCDCVPIQQECSPNDAKTDCKQVVCPDPNQICRPMAISWIPGTPPQVEACDCIDPNEQCHVEYTAADGPFCVGQCPAGETCELFGLDTDGDGVTDYWTCDCVPIQLECGPNATQQWCNPVACPAAGQFCVPIVIEIDPINGQVRVVECECISQTGDGCHVTYDPASLQPFCEGNCPPGETCELFGVDVNGDGVDDQFKCDCVQGPLDCGPNADGTACEHVICPLANEICVPKVIQLVPGAAPTIQVCDCIDPNTQCHIEYNAAQGPHCVGDCPPGQTCELRQVDTDGDGVDDTFGCDCVPDVSGNCEPNATATGCNQTVCPTPGDVCRPIIVAVGPNGQFMVKKCDCITPNVDCHVEFDAANQPYCVGTCPDGTTCELLGKDTNGDGIDDHFKCDCVPPLSECVPDSTGLDCKPTHCPVAGEICRPKVIKWLPGTPPFVDECECVNPDECHIEFDAATLEPVCTGICPDGTKCERFADDTDGDGVVDRWECACVPVTGQCAPKDDGSGCQPTVCPIPGEECSPKVITLVPGATPVVKVCDCVGPNECHVELDAANQPFCVGACPDGTACQMFKHDSDGDGVDDTFKCDCVQVDPVCEPTTDGKDCNAVVCPIAGQKCVPTHVSCVAGAGCFVVSCECRNSSECHVAVSPPATDPPVVCQGLCPIGYKCIPRQDSATGLYECQCVKKPDIIVIWDVILKSRYASIVRGAGNVAGGGASEAIRLRLVSLDGYPVFEGEDRWLGQPQDFPEENSALPGLTFKGARLECSPRFDDWTPYGAIQIYGGEMIPNSEYMIQAVDSSCPDLDNDECYSDPVFVRTGKFGDVVPLFDDPANPAQPDFNDIASEVAKFVASPTAPIKARAQLQPNTPFPSRSIDFKDIATDVGAFTGTNYWEQATTTGPCTCPSSVTCNTTPCATDLQCGGGLCVGGFCRDACQRCTQP